MKEKSERSLDLEIRTGDAWQRLKDTEASVHFFGQLTTPLQVSGASETLLEAQEEHACLRADHLEVATDFFQYMHKYRKAIPIDVNITRLLGEEGLVYNVELSSSRASAETLMLYLSTYQSMRNRVLDGNRRYCKLKEYVYQELRLACTASSDYADHRSVVTYLKLEDGVVVLKQKHLDKNDCPESGNISMRFYQEAIKELQRFQTKSGLNMRFHYREAEAEKEEMQEKEGE